MKRTGQISRAKRNRLKLLTLSLVMLGLLISGYAMRLYKQARKTANIVYQPTTTSKINSKKIKAKQPISILLLGIDTGADGRLDKGNSDSMIIATINPQQQTTQLVSIPRDTAAEMIGTKDFNMQKINAAYNIGGATMAKQTVASLVNAPINYYVTINMGGLKQIVDAVGGVDVDVPFTFTSKWTGGQHFTKGPMHLDGEMALAYARMRHEDLQKGDYGRQERQQQVIKSLIKSAVSVNGLSRFSDLLKTLSKNLVTDLSFDEMMATFKTYQTAAKNISSTTIQGQNAYVQTAQYPQPLAYQIASDQELQRVSDQVRTALSLEKAPLNNSETQQNARNPYYIFGATEVQNYTIYNLN